MSFSYFQGPRDAPDPDRDGARGGSFRLVGEIEGRRRSFLLHPGANRIGSSPANDIVLPVTGVSRRHAVLEIGPEGIGLRDAESKNGTFLGGRRIDAARARPGDRIGVGPVELTVEEIALGDAVIVIRGPAASAPPVETAQAEEDGPRTAPLPAFDPATLRIWLTALEQALGEGGRRGGGTDLGTRLGEVAGVLGADGVALLDLHDGVARVVGAWGSVTEGGHLTIAEDALTASGDGMRSQLRIRPGGSPGALLVDRTGSGRPRALVLAGDFPASEQSEPLLRLLLRALAPSAPPEGGAPRVRHAAEEPLRFPPGYVVGQSAAMRSLYRQLSSLVGSGAPVLVVGETGVGKEPLARTVHESSRRRGAPFVAVNCAAIPAELLEAELFGVAQGAATGVSERPGLFLEVDGGTLLLDEIGDMPLALQAKLLRAIENGEIHRVGGGLRKADVRVLAATNVDLPEKVAEGGFRADLYYRVAAHVLQVPPLRERPEDLPALTERFLRTAATSQGRSVAGLTAAALEALVRYPWPGNVRELENVVGRLVTACPEGELIDSSRVAETISLTEPPGTGAAPGAPAASDATLQDRLDALERRLIEEALAEAEGNRSEAARRLGIHRNSLSTKMTRLGIDPDDAAAG